MVDIHCHILPGVDDGPISLNNTIEMLKIAEKDGINKIIATPHMNYKYMENRYSSVEMMVDEINILLRSQGFNIEILAGQEVLIHKYTTENYKNGFIKGLNGTNYTLVELPFGEMSNYILEELYKLRVMGFIPIIAHPERYKFIINDPSLINDFIDLGCLFQINSHSILGLFGRDIKKTAEIFIENRICQFIASDAHSEGRRCPIINIALKNITKIDSDLAGRFRPNSYKLMNNEAIEYSDNKIKKKRKIHHFWISRI